MNILSRITESRFMTGLTNILFGATIIVAGLFIYWSFQDDNILTELEGNYSLERLHYSQGEVLPIKFSLCKNKHLREKVYGRFVDGAIFAVPEQISEFSIDCYNSQLVRVSIPDTLPDGEYYYEETITYQVNPIKTKTYVFRTPKFEVSGGQCE